MPLMVCDDIWLWKTLRPSSSLTEPSLLLSIRAKRSAIFALSSVPPLPFVFSLAEAVISSSVIPPSLFASIFENIFACICDIAEADIDPICICHLRSSTCL